jgi:diacylglycerol kinase family enzyme
MRPYEEPAEERDVQRSVTCILNCKAGSQVEAGVRAYLERLTVEHRGEVSIVCSGGEDLENLARQASKTGGVVAAGGGDGTVSAVAAALVDSDAVLGVLPLGTLNHFAKDMRIPLDLEHAVSTLFTGAEVPIDVGEVNGRIFLNNSSIGFYPQIVREREQQQRLGDPKWLAFAHAVAHVARHGITLHVRFDDGRKGAHPIETPFVFVGNNPYNVTGLEIGTRARLDCGTLWLCAAPHASRAKLLRLALGALVGWVDTAALIRSEVKTVHIHARRSYLLVARDGEVDVMQTPLHYRVRPQALRVLVPRKN